MLVPNWKDIFPFLFSGILLGLTMFHLQNMWWLVFFFLIPILIYFDSCATGNGLLKSKKNFVLMFLFSFAFTFISTLWICTSLSLDWLHLENKVVSILIIIGVWLSAVCIMCLPIAFWGVGECVLRGFSPLQHALIGSSLWIALEYVRSWGVVFGIYGDQALLGPHHTYYSLAHALPAAPFLNELIPVGGVYLGSFIIIIINYFFYYLFFKKIKWTNLFFLGFLPLAIVSVCVITMDNIRKNADAVASQISLINSYYPITKNTAEVMEKARNSYEYIKQLGNTGNIIVLPENFDVLEQFNDDSSEKENYWASTTVVIGSFTGNSSYNLFFLSPKTKEISYYQKQLLMPVGEYGIFWVQFLIKTFSTDGWIEKYVDIYGKKKKGKGPYVFQNIEPSNHKIAGSLCSENISPYIFRDATRLGAQLLVNSGSHAPFHDSKLLFRQTLAINSLRALETGRYVVTALNHNPSFVISDKGIVMDIFDSKELIASKDIMIEFQSYITPYTKYGDIIVYLCIMYVLFVYIWRASCINLSQN